MSTPRRTVSTCARASLLCTFLAALGASVSGHAATAKSFRSTRSILALSPEEARSAVPAQLRGVVTAVGQGGLFLQDASAGIWIFCAEPARMRQGDEIAVEGIVGPGTYSPVVQASSIRILGRAVLPRPQPASFVELSSGDLDSQFVSVEGWVRAAGIRQGERERSWLKLQVAGGQLFVSLPLEELERAKRLIGSYVRLQAVGSSTKNEGRQITSPTLVASSVDSATLLRPAPQDLFSEPAMPIGKLMQYRSGASVDTRVKVQGTVTYDTPGQGLIVEDRGHALSISSMQTDALRLGERIEAVGFPTLAASGPVLDDTLFRSLGDGLPVRPSAVTSDQLAEGTYNNTLISIEGKLVRRVLEPAKVVLLMQSGSAIVLGELVRDDNVGELEALREGTRVRVTGICVLDVQGTWNLGPASSHTISYKVLLRQPSDVAVLGPPSWWTAHHLVYLSAGLSLILLALIALGVWGRIKHWRLKMVMAERERFSHELHDTLAQGFAGLGFQLQAIRRAVPEQMPELRAQVDLASKLARHSHKEARGSFEPMLPAIDESGELLDTLEATARMLTAGGEVGVVARRVGSAVRLPVELERELRGIGQEAIANAVRHANPKRIELSIDYHPDAIRLSVRDDGCGFVKSGNLLGFGLNGMRRRAAALQAELEITTLPGAGTIVTLNAPLPRRRTLAQIWLLLLAAKRRSAHALTK